MRGMRCMQGRLPGGHDGRVSLSSSADASAQVRTRYAVLGLSTPAMHLPHVHPVMMFSCKHETSKPQHETEGS